MNNKVRVFIALGITILGVGCVYAFVHTKFSHDSVEISHSVPQATEQVSIIGDSSTITSSGETVQDMDKKENSSDSTVVAADDSDDSAVIDNNNASEASENVEGSAPAEEGSKDIVITPDVGVDVVKLGSTDSNESSGTYFKAQDGDITQSQSMYKVLTKKDHDVVFKNDSSLYREWVVNIGNQQISTGVIAPGKNKCLNVWKFSVDPYSEYSVTVNDRETEDADVNSSYTIKLKISREED